MKGTFVVETTNTPVARAATADAAAAITAAPTEAQMQTARAFWSGLALAAALGLGAWAATAGTAEAAGPAVVPSALVETGTVTPPRGFTELCARHPEYCPARTGGAERAKMERAMAALFGHGALAAEAPELTAARWRQLTQVNHAVNATIEPVADLGPDHWSVNALQGDCEEYVLMKREMLARLGWPRTALRITVVRDAVGYHAILVVSTDRGEFVLDNMVSEIGRVEESPYEFVVAQSSRAPGEWVRVSRLR